MICQGVFAVESTQMLLPSQSSPSRSCHPWEHPTQRNLNPHSPSLLSSSQSLKVHSDFSLSPSWPLAHSFPPSPSLARSTPPDTPWLHLFNTVAAKPRHENSVYSLRGRRCDGVICFDIGGWRSAQSMFCSWCAREEGAWNDATVHTIVEVSTYPWHPLE